MARRWPAIKLEFLRQPAAIARQSNAMFAVSSIDPVCEFVPAPDALDAGASAMAGGRNTRPLADTGTSGASATDDPGPQLRRRPVRASTPAVGRAARRGAGRGARPESRLLRAGQNAATCTPRSGGINRGLRRVQSAHVLCEPIRLPHMATEDGRSTTRGTLAMLAVIRYRVQQLQESGPKCDQQVLTKHLAVLDAHAAAVRDDAGRCAGVLSAETAQAILRTLAALKPVAQGGGDTRLLNLLKAGRLQMQGGAAAVIHADVVAVRKDQLQYLANPGVSRITSLNGNLRIPLAPPGGVVPTVTIGGGIAWGRATDDDSSIVELRQIEGSLGAGVMIGVDVGLGEATVSANAIGAGESSAGQCYSNREEYAASRYSEGGKGVVHAPEAVALRGAAQSFATSASFLKSAPPTLMQRLGMAFRAAAGWKSAYEGYSTAQLSQMIEDAHYASKDFTHALMLAAPPGTPAHRIPLPPTWRNPAHEALPGVYNASTVGVMGSVVAQAGLAKTGLLSHMAASAGIEVQSSWTTVVPRSRTFFWDAVRADDSLASVPGGDADRMARIHALLAHLPSINDALARLGPGKAARLEKADGRQLGAMLDKIRYSYDAYVQAIRDKRSNATVQLVDAIERHWGTSTGPTRQSRPAKDDAVM